MVNTESTILSVSTQGGITEKEQIPTQTGQANATLLSLRGETLPSLPDGDRNGDGD